MKPSPAPPVPGNTEWERFDNAVSKLLSVPKEAFLRAEAKLKRRREKKRAVKKLGSGYPLLGGSHYAGKVLHKAVHRIRPKTLEAGVWYHARHDGGEIPPIKDFLVRDPITQEFALFFHSD